MWSMPDVQGPGAPPPEPRSCSETRRDFATSAGTGRSRRLRLLCDERQEDIRRGVSPRDMALEGRIAVCLGRLKEADAPLRKLRADPPGRAAADLALFALEISALTHQSPSTRCWNERPPIPRTPPSAQMKGTWSPGKPCTSQTLLSISNNAKTDFCSAIE